MNLIFEYLIVFNLYLNMKKVQVTILILWIGVIGTLAADSDVQLRSHKGIVQNIQFNYFKFKILRIL